MVQIGNYHGTIGHHREDFVGDFHHLDLEKDESSVLRTDRYSSRATRVARCSYFDDIPVLIDLNLQTLQDLELVSSILDFSR